MGPPGDKKMNCNEIHPVRSFAKVRAIARAVRRGESIMPYVIDGIPGNCNLITGTHRQAANMLLERMGDKRRVPFVALDDLADHPAMAEIANLIEDGDFAEINFLVDDADIFGLAP